MSRDVIANHPQYASIIKARRDHAKESERRHALNQKAMDRYDEARAAYTEEIRASTVTGDDVGPQPTFTSPVNLVELFSMSDSIDRQERQWLDVHRAELLDDLGTVEREWWERVLLALEGLDVLALEGAAVLAQARRIHGGQPADAWGGWRSNVDAEALCVMRTIDARPLHGPRNTYLAALR